jgi:CRISPR/Cas system-associated exonuclease Cas4 (RecB family)
MKGRMMPSVSHSEVDSYLLCRRKHYYGYGLSLQRVRESSSLATGTAGHRILEAFYRTILDTGLTVEEQQTGFHKAMDVALATYEEIVNEGYEDGDRRAKLKDILFNTEYGYFNNEFFVNNGWRILAVEADYNLLYDEETQASYPFVVDLIVQDPEGAYVVIDHKFVYDFYTPESTDLQPQIPKYIGALRALGHEVAYGAYNMLRTRTIKEPTAESNHFFMILKPNATRITTTFMEQLGVAAEIQALKELPLDVQEKRAYRTANKMICQSCSFRDLCSTELMGGNVELMKKTEYKIRERKEFSLPTEMDDK